MLIAVSGSQDFMRRRQVAKAIETQMKNGWRVERVSGDNINDVMNTISQGGGLFQESRPLLVVISSPEKLDLALLESWKTGESTVLLDYEGDPKKNTKFGKWLSELDKKCHFAFPKTEKKWELKAEAVQFCIGEAKRHGKKLSEDLANQIVRRCGMDFGFLSFEIEKYALLSEGSDIDIQSVRDAIASFGEPSYDALREAFRARNTAQVLLALGTFKKAFKEAPVMPLAGFIENLVLGKKDGFGWLHIATELSRGASHDDICSKYGINTWHFKKNLLPEVSNWTPESLLQLLSLSGRARRALLLGKSNPWVIFTSGINAVCQ